MIKNEKYKISGMSCAACQARVEKTVSNLKGVKACSVNLITNSMQIDRDESLNVDEVINSVTSIGYGASLLTEEMPDLSNKKEIHHLIFRLVTSLILLVPLFYLGMGYMLSWPLFGLEHNLILLGSIELVLSLLIMVTNNHFYIGGTKAIFKGGPNMNTLVALGSGVAFIYSTILFIIMCVNSNNHDYMMSLMMNVSFETAGMVPTLITIGKLLEAISKGRTTSAIKDLLELTPKTAHVLRDGKEEMVETSSLKVGDIVLIKPGECFPIDGIVIEGSSSVDESSLTGESLPIEKDIGSEVKSGTINQNGALICKSIRVGNDTIISQIVKMVETASGTKTKISRLADKISNVFVPVVIGIATITFLGWFIFGDTFVNSHNIEQTTLSYAISRGISVLVISCPCALGLATPVAIMVGNGKGAKNGILFKTAEALEETGKIKIVAFDKTGTITTGNPKVVDILSFDKDELLKVAYTLEERSEHPLAKAIVEYSKDNNIDKYALKDFSSQTGIGISGIIDNKKATACSESYFQKLGINNPYKEEMENIKKHGRTPLFFIFDNRLLGIIFVMDQIKEDAKEAIAKIKTIGITPIMISGDNKVVAKAIAEEAGIDYFVSEVLPNEKLDVINHLKQFGKVMMVGDGINDSPALVGADIGLAFNRGSDIALDSADIVLTKSSLMDVYGAINLSKRTMLNIKENLFWAFFYNLIMIPIAAGVFAPLGLIKLAPWMGASAMSLSSVTVVLNALRLNLINIYKDRKNKECIEINLNYKKEEKDMKEIVLNVEGMMCPHCVKRVKDALESVDGVNSADVSLENKSAAVSLQKDIEKSILIKAVNSAGYKAK